MLDYLIVGQGLAGTYFSRLLHEQGRSFLLFSNEKEGASHAAAGMFNPVVLKRFRMIWNSETILDSWKPAIEYFESTLGQSIVMGTGAYRRFASLEEQNTWVEKSDHPKFEKYLGRVHSSKIEGISTPFGFGEVDEVGRLNLPSLFKAWKQYLIETAAYQHQHFDYNKLRVLDDHVAYGDITAKQIIFCEGARVKDNPYFNQLPIVPNKGEYIKLAVEKAPDKMLGAGHFVLPDSDKEVTIGATYSPNDDSEGVTDEARDTLLAFWESISTQKYHVIGQVSGVRPTVKDRRPLIGQHPQFKPLYLLNGFGSRGVLMGPWLSNQLFNFIEYQTPINEECDLKRYIK